MLSDIFPNAIENRINVKFPPRITPFRLVLKSSNRLVHGYNITFYPITISIFLENISNIYLSSVLDYDTFISCMSLLSTPIK
jgi:hypothetical protein